jgi:hypothetical protein
MAHQPVAARQAALAFTLLLLPCAASSQTTDLWRMNALPGTGQTRKYTATPGEDADHPGLAPSFRLLKAGIVLDDVTGLVWQQTDGGEMTWAIAQTYCVALQLGGFHDWRLPGPHESFSILNHGRNPALDATYFPRTEAEYWWTSVALQGDSNRIWVTNSGGGLGPHPSNETVSAGGPKRFDARCVRAGQPVPSPAPTRFVLHSDGSVLDRATGLVWLVAAQQIMTWEEALALASARAKEDKTGWRLPNIKELDTLDDPAFVHPAIDRKIFPSVLPAPVWSSTTLFNREPTRAWIVDFNLGIVTYDLKTVRHIVLIVHGAD